MKLDNENIFVVEIKNILAQARQKAYSAVNTAMVEAYWQMGKRIVEQEQHGEQKAAYGEALLKNLSIALTQEFGKGFSYANLRNFRQFYITYPNSENCYALRSKLSWTHHRLIMRVENNNARDYYLNEAAEQNWSSRVLERNINTFYFQRLPNRRHYPAHSSRLSLTDRFLRSMPLTSYKHSPLYKRCHRLFVYVQELCRECQMRCIPSSKCLN